MFANGLSTVISGFFGSTPNTTYGENIGVMAITRVYSTLVIGGAAIFAILLSCVGKLAAAIQMIPLPVMGGVSLLLYGVIGASGIRVLIESKVGLQQSTEPDPDFRDFDHRRQWREGKHRRGGVKRYGAGDHRRYRLKFDFQTDQCAAP